MCDVKRQKHNFIAPQSISRHLHCCICHEVFDDPVRTVCGHTFCYICIQKWANINKKCPICKISIRQRKLQKDFIASLIIDDLMIRCSHEGCKWEGAHALYKKHQRSCTFKIKKSFVEPVYLDSIVVDCKSDSDSIEEVQKQSKYLLN